MSFTLNDRSHASPAHTLGAATAADPAAAGANFAVVVLASLAAGSAGEDLFADFLTGLMTGVDRRRAAFSANGEGR
jgi:hypothetical protein